MSQQPERFLCPRVFPFLLVLQSGRYDNLATRLCAPLILRSIASPGVLEQHVTPSFVVEGQQVFLSPFDITPVPVERLGPVVASLAGDDDARRSQTTARRSERERDRGWKQKDADKATWVAPPR